MFSTRPAWLGLHYLYNDNRAVVLHSLEYDTLEHTKAGGANRGKLPRPPTPSSAGVVLHAVVVVAAGLVLRELPVRLLQARVRLQPRHVLAQVVAVVLVA
eukprot:COSAG06_NODE_613_length_13796_cov_45.631525_11_plen_100_part_00